jgi:hypothetical protein
VLDSDSIDSVTISGTNRFDISTDTSGSEKTVVGYTGNATGQGGTTSLATVTIDSGATDATLSVNDIVTFSDTTGNEIKPRNTGDSISINEDDSNENGDDGSSPGGSSGGSIDPSDAEEEQEEQEESETAPTVDEIEETVEETEPDTTETVDVTEVGEETEDGGVEVDTDAVSEEPLSVDQITFESTEVGSVTVEQYSDSDIIETVEESIQEQVAQVVEEDVQEDIESGVEEDVEESAGEDINGDTGGTSQDSGSAASGSSVSVDVATVSNIEPDNTDVSATVTMSAARDKIDDPQQADIYKEGNDGWVEVPTEIEEIGEEEVTFSGDVESFSVFAVAETDAGDGNTATAGDESSSTNETEDESDRNSNDFIPGFGVASSIAALGSLGYLLKRRRN